MGAVVQLYGDNEIPRTLVWLAQRAVTIVLFYFQVIMKCISHYEANKTA